MLSNVAAVRGGRDFALAGCLVVSGDIFGCENLVGRDAPRPLVGRGWGC